MADWGTLMPENLLNPDPVEQAWSRLERSGALPSEIAAFEAAIREQSVAPYVKALQEWVRANDAYYKHDSPHNTRRVWDAEAALRALVDPDATEEVKA